MVSVIAPLSREMLTPKNMQQGFGDEKKKLHKRSRSFTLDCVKMLKEKRSKFERGILKLTGAAKLAEEQYKQVAQRGQCSLCQCTLPTVTMTAGERTKRTLMLCESSRNKYLEKHRACMSELSMLGGNELLKKSVHSDEWCSFEYKKGKIATLREQKAQSLKSQECVVCGSAVKDFETFLSSVDRQICQLESELHVHQNN